MIRRATPVLIATSMILFLACGEREITIGPDRDTGGNYWGRNVSKEFERAELAALHKEMNSPGTKQEIVDLNCGKALASHEYSVTLWPEGAHRERIVRLQMTPRLYEGDECLQQAVNYVFQRNVKAMDPGPPIDYGYKDPLTGKPLGPSEDIDIPEKPHCTCGPSGSQLQPAVTQGVTRCPSFDALGRLVDERVLAIKPGVSLMEFTTSGPARHALNFWDDVAGGLRETGFYVPVSEENTIVSDQVVCRFGAVLLRSRGDA